MIILFAALTVQAAAPAWGPPQASASLVVEGAVAVSSITPIRLKDGRIDGPVVIGVSGDPGRAYRLQVQTTLTEAGGHTRVVSAANGEIGVAGAARTGPDGLDRLQIFGATLLLRPVAGGRTVLPLGIVYE